MTQQEFTMERVFDAPRELVFKMFSKAEHLKHWWGPRGWVLPVCHLDFRPGGTWHFCMKCVEKNQGEEELWRKAIYKEIVNGEKIVYTDYFSDAEGNVNEALPVGEVTLYFEAHEGKTKLIVVVKYPAARALKQILNIGMEEWFNQMYNCLQKHMIENVFHVRTRKMIIRKMHVQRQSITSR
ncbi:SRPBCC domain-containing protein [Bacillus sp. FSL W7-1360]